MFCASATSGSHEGANNLDTSFPEILFLLTSLKS